MKVGMACVETRARAMGALRTELSGKVSKVKFLQGLS